MGTAGIDVLVSARRPVDHRLIGVSLLGGLVGPGQAGRAEARAVTVARCHGVARITRAVNEALDKILGADRRVDAHAGVVSVCICQRRIATVSTEGAPVTVSGIAGANLDSGTGPVRATDIGGPLTVITGGGPLTLDGLAGTLSADTGGGPLTARGVASATATITTGGGDARLAFSADPDTVMVSTDGGSAQLAVPGGPYALTADSNGGSQSVGIATDPAAGLLDYGHQRWRAAMDRAGLPLTRTAGEDRRDGRAGPWAAGQQRDEK